MHHHAEAWLPTDADVEGKLERVMDPYRQYANPDGFWDWYQIGGRFRGRLVRGYDPRKDPSLHGDCRLCNGTGDRPGWVTYEDGERRFKHQHAAACNGCNGCQGTGQALVLPPLWGEHESDVMEVPDVPDDLVCHTLIVGDLVMHVDAWTSEGFAGGRFDGSVKEALGELGVTRGYLVTVDYHC